MCDNDLITRYSHQLQAETIRDVSCSDRLDVMKPRKDKSLQQTKPVPEREWKIFHFLHLLKAGQFEKSTLGRPRSWRHFLPPCFPKRTFKIWVISSGTFHSLHEFICIIIFPVQNLWNATTVLRRSILSYRSVCTYQGGCCQQEVLCCLNWISDASWLRKVKKPENEKINGFIQSGFKLTGRFGSNNKGKIICWKVNFGHIKKFLKKAFFQGPFTAIEVFSVPAVGIGSGPKFPSCKCGKFAAWLNSTVFKTMCVYKSYTPLFKL